MFKDECSNILLAVLKSRGSSDSGSDSGSGSTSTKDNILIPLLDGTLTYIKAGDLQGLTKMYANPFKNCHGLQVVVIPNSVNEIEYNTFSSSNFSYLTDIYIDKPEDSIDGAPWGAVLDSDEEAIKGVNIHWNSAGPIEPPQLLPPLAFDLDMYCYDEEAGAYIITGIGDCTREEILIPDTVNYDYYYHVERISDNAFENCNTITRVWTGGMMDIGARAFYNCDNLREVHIKVDFWNENIGDDAFAECENLTDIYIDVPEGTIDTSNWGAPNATVHWAPPPDKPYGGFTFYAHIDEEAGETEPSEVTVYAPKWVNDPEVLVPDIDPNTNYPVTVLADHYSHTSNWSYVMKVVVPNSIRSIKTGAFDSASNLRIIKIGNGIGSIATDVFANCSKLTDIYIDKLRGLLKGEPWGATNATIHWRAPDLVDDPQEPQEPTEGLYIEATDYDGDSNVDGAELYDHGGCTDNWIRIPETYNCYNYNEDQMVDYDVKYIHDRAFEYCEWLQRITIPSTVTHIGGNTFIGCTNLTDIYIGGPEDSISGAPWGAPNATVHWNSPAPNESQT